MADADNTLNPSAEKVAKATNPFHAIDMRELLGSRKPLTLCHGYHALWHVANMGLADEVTDGIWAFMSSIAETLTGMSGCDKWENRNRLQLARLMITEYEDEMRGHELLAAVERDLR